MIYSDFLLLVCNHPIAIGIDEDWEKFFCTGSIAYAYNKFYAFDGTRLVNKEGKVNEQLRYAIRKDCIYLKTIQIN